MDKNQKDLEDHLDDIEDMEVYDSDQEGQMEVEQERVDPDQLRIQMAQEIIQKTKQELEDDYFEKSAEEEDIKEYLQQKIIKRKKKIKKNYFQDLKDNFDKNHKNFPKKILKGHKKPITICVFNPENDDLFTAGKDGVILVFKESENYKRYIFANNSSKQQNGHSQPILAMDISHDGRFIITAGKDKVIKIWLVKKQILYHTLKGHKRNINVLKFKRDSYEFFSGAEDGKMKIWDAEQKGIIDTVFGHSSLMTAIENLNEQQLVSTGYDRKPIVWKLQENQQMVYSDRLSSIDCVVPMSKYHFVTGTEGGEISVWTVNKKKPRVIINQAHQNGWISSLTGFYNGDVVVSGANDGSINFYRGNFENQKSLALEKNFSISVKGVIVDLKLNHSYSKMAVVVSQENKLGRWTPLKVKQKIIIFDLFNQLIKIQ